MAETLPPRMLPPPRTAVIPGFAGGLAAVRVLCRTLLRFDREDGGPMTVRGTVAIDGAPAVPVARRVRLFDAPSGRLVRETWSDEAGAFAFHKLRAGRFFVVAHDHTGEFDAVIHDRIDAETPP